MKLKSIAMLAASLFILVSIAPLAGAEDINSNPAGQSMQTPTDNTVTNQSNDMLNNPSQNDNMGNNPNNEMSPDTASGDDDY